MSWWAWAILGFVIAANIIDGVTRFIAKRQAKRAAAGTRTIIMTIKGDSMLESFDDATWCLTLFSVQMFKPDHLPSS